MHAIVDTSAIIALLRVDEPMHAAVSAAIAIERGSIIVPSPVVVETAQLVGRLLGASAEARWVRSLVTGPWEIEPVGSTDMDRAAALLEQYRDADLGFVDASIVAMAERLGSVRIHTLDRRDFGMVRPSHVPAFDLLPFP